jgi:hypothetical protein
VEIYTTEYGIHSVELLDELTFGRMSNTRLAAKKLPTGKIYKGLNWGLRIVADIACPKADFGVTGRKLSTNTKSNYCGIFTADEI